MLKSKDIATTRPALFSCNLILGGDLKASCCCTACAQHCANPTSTAAHVRLCSRLAPAATAQGRTHCPRQHLMPASTRAHSRSLRTEAVFAASTEEWTALLGNRCAGSTSTIISEA
eukprot:6492280-Amphidinium_carterae.10